MISNLGITCTHRLHRQLVLQLGSLLRQVFQLLRSLCSVKLFTHTYLTCRTSFDIFSHSLTMAKKAELTSHMISRSHDSISHTRSTMCKLVFLLSLTRYTHYYCIQAAASPFPHTPQYGEQPSLCTLSDTPHT